MNRIKKLMMTSCPLMFFGCELDQNSNFRYEEEVHNEYYYKLKENPNYKLKVQKLNIDYDIEKENIFCYSKAKTDEEKFKTIIHYLREDIPLECDDQQALVGPSDCTIDSSELDSASQEHSDDMAKNNFVSNEGSDGSTPKERAENNGYNGEHVVEEVLSQDLSSGETIPHMIEKAIKSKKGFCSMVLDKQALHISVKKAQNGDKAYWTFMYGDDRQ